MANQEIDTSSPGADKNLVSETAQALLSSDTILSAIRSFKPKNDEDGIALEFVNSYLNFMKGIIEHDVEKSINRTDFEIRDLISHVNIMMRNKDEFTFNTMVMHCPAHYRNLLQAHLARAHGENK